MQGRGKESRQAIFCDVATPPFNHIKICQDVKDVYGAGCLSFNLSGASLRKLGEEANTDETRSTLLLSAIPSLMSINISMLNNNK